MAKTSAERQKEYREREKEKKAQAQAEKEKQEGAAAPAEFKGRPTIEDAEAAYLDGDKDGERIAAAIMRRYNKAQTWAFILYRDSVIGDYEAQLRMTGVQFALSPWHDADKDKLGNKKKDHLHGMIHWPGGATTYRTAAAITRDLLHGTIPIPLVSPRGYYRYFTHLDNPEKAQYNPDEIVTGNGFDIGEFLQLTSKEKNDLAKMLVEEIIKQDITEYWDLVVYSMYNMDAAAFEFVRTNTMFLQGTIRSKCGRQKTDEEMAKIKMAAYQAAYDERLAELRASGTPGPEV